MQLEQRNNDHKQEENDGLGLTDALPLGSGACVERVVDVVGQHHGLLCRLTGCQREVLVEQLEGVRQRQEGATKKDRRINTVLSVLFTILCIAWLYPVFMILMNSDRKSVV